MYSLKDFMNIDFLYDVKVLSSNIDIDNVAIKHICAMEIPAENFIREKDLILTTAMGCYEDIEVFLKFVKEIYASGASVLVVSRKDNNFSCHRKCRILQIM